MHFIIVHAEQITHKLVRFADELHIAVLNAIVHHFHEMSCTVFADPVAAWRAVLDLGADALENGLHIRPRGRASARHHAGAFQCALFAAGHAGADVKLALAFHVSGSADGVREVGIAAVNENIAVVEQRKKLLDHIVYGLSRFDHHKHLARLFQIVNQFFETVAANDIFSGGSAVDELVHFFRRAVEDRHSEALRLHVHDQVFTHNGKADETNICFFHLCTLAFPL